MVRWVAIECHPCLWAALAGAACNTQLASARPTRGVAHTSSLPQSSGMGASLLQLAGCERMPTACGQPAASPREPWVTSGLWLSPLLVAPFCQRKNHSLVLSSWLCFQQLPCTFFVSTVCAHTCLPCGTSNTPMPGVLLYLPLLTGQSSRRMPVTRARCWSRGPGTLPGNSPLEHFLTRHHPPATLRP